MNEVEITGHGLAVGRVMFAVQAQLDRHQENSGPATLGRVAAPAVVIFVMVSQVRVVRSTPMPGGWPRRCVTELP